MDQTALLDHPSLDDLPYKVETDAFGNIVMTPAKFWHSRMQSRVYDRLHELAESGEVLAECSIDTTEGVKVADVVWFSTAFLKKNEHAEFLPEAPELCVEVKSRSNTAKEMDQKRRLYFERGAKEVWLCNEGGVIRFFTPSGEVEASILFPAFPKSLPH